MPWYFLLGYLVFGTLIASATAWSAAREDRDALLDEREADAASRAAEAERQRIARDLHDLLGHTLSLVTLKADLAGRVFDADPQRARAELSQIERISREALAEVREAVTGLRGRPLDEVAAEVAGRLRAAGIAVEMRLDAPGTLDAPHAAALGMLVREGATNVLRHAEAARVEIRLERSGGRGRLVVSDDGRGGAAYAGRGLDGLRDRLAEAGMRLEIGAGAGGRGTRLEAVWPEREEADS